MEFKANSGIWGIMFGVPYIVADNFLKLATGNQLKVLLYCLRSSGRCCTEDEIARNTGVPASEIADCIMFWQQANVLEGIEGGAYEQTPVRSVFTAPVLPSPETLAAEKPKTVERPKQNLSPSDISEMIKTSSDISELFKICETALGPLNHTQQNSLIWILNHLGLKKEVIVTLVFYCAQIEKTNTAYIEKIAASWAENEINTLSSAQKEVQRLTDEQEFSGKIMKIFEMDRRPTPKQSEYISSWKKAGLSIELIKYAYEKTLDRLNKLSFDYINKILMSWSESGFSTTADVDAAESDFKKKKSKSKKSDEAVSDIEKYNVVINKF